MRSRRFRWSSGLPVLLGTLLSGCAAAVHMPSSTAKVANSKELHPDVPAVVQLADEQLRCYNRADLNGFCACYSADVVVLNADGRVRLSGREEFRKSYAAMFARFKDVRADILGRLWCGPHLVEHEVFRRTDRDSGQTTMGQLLVRYTARDNRIAVVQFFD